MLAPSPIFKPSLRSLAYILRHREYWPEGHVWNFKYHTACAVGLAFKLWPKLQLFDQMDDDDFRVIFIRADTKPQVPYLFGLLSRNRRHVEVSPEMVADQIDELLERSVECLNYVPVEVV